MKRLFVIVSFCMTLCSCDPNSCVEYDIYNKTTNKLELVSFTNGIKSRDLKIRPSSYVGYLSICNATRDISDSEVYYKSNYKLDDSTYVYVNDSLVKVYYYGDKGDKKSIYNKNNKEHWKLVKKERSLVEYVFEITEEDFK